MTDVAGWQPSRDVVGELTRVIVHARNTLADADRQLAHLDDVLAIGTALLPESLTYFAVERDAAQYRRNLWGAKVDQLERYAHEHHGLTVPSVPCSSRSTSTP